MAKIQVKVEPQERLCGNWLRAYLEYTKESESPDNYHVWTALSSIASVVRRNVWLDQGLYVLYPNLYVALVGPPARTAKSTAIRLGRRLIQSVPGVIIGPDACSREQLIKKMAESKFDNQCAMTIHSSEMSSIIDVSGLTMIQFLTDIYDCDYANPGGWKYETKTQGKDTIVNPYLNMLVGTTPTYLAESMPSNVIGHGFTSRTVFVYEERERLRNPRPNLEDKELARMLVGDLQYIANIFGEFHWTQDGQEEYDRFYNALYDHPPVDERLEGYHWRKKIHVLKVAMLLSLAERDDKLITAADIKAAAEFLLAVEPNMSRVFSAVGKYDHASDIERISAMVNSNGGISVAEIFRRSYHIGSGDDIRQILTTLVMMGAIQLKRDGERNEWALPGPNPIRQL